MSSGLAWASRRDHALVEEPQQRRLVEWTDQGTRRRAEWEDQDARRRAEWEDRTTHHLAKVAASISATMAQLKADVSAAIAEALQATRSVRHEELDLAPTTTTAVVISEPSASIQMSGGASSISTAGGGASASHDSDHVSAVPITCSTQGPGRDDGSSEATKAASASATRVASPACVVHEGDNDFISAAPSKHIYANAPLDFTSVPMMPSHIATEIEHVTASSCSMECHDDVTPQGRR